MDNVVQDTINALSLGSIYALFTLGLALIFGVMNLLNFAHGALIAVSGYAMYELSTRFGASVVIVGGLLTAVVLALLMERVAFRPVRGANPATLLVTSFAVAYLLQSLIVLTFDAVPKSVSVAPFLTESVSISGIDVSRLSIATLVVTAALLLALLALLRRTPIGLQMRAAAEDFEMARLAGVRADRVIGVAFALSGALGGVAAVLLVAQTGQLTPDMGLAPVLIAFVATIIGGLGSLAGAVLGGMFLGATTVVLDATLPLSARPFRDAFLYGAVILILLLRPQGLIQSVAGRSARV